MSEAAGPVLRDGRSLGAETRIGSEGELEISGAQLFLGYSSEGRFAEAPEWFPTGDQFCKEGERLLFCARLRELIDLEGRKVAPALLEEVFEGMPEIRDCLAFELELQGRVSAAFVYVRAEDCDLSEEELAAKVEHRARTSLSVDMRPRWWREVGEIPRLSNGKADRKKVKTDWSCP
jgi:acyl-CoA synthetase (AMP-forming)/AMP-acid ligase II